MRDTNRTGGYTLNERILCRGRNKNLVLLIVIVSKNLFFSFTTKTKHNTNVKRGYFQSNIGLSYIYRTISILSFDRYKERERKNETNKQTIFSGQAK